MKIITSIVLATVLCAGTVYAGKPEWAGKNKKEKHEKKKNKKQKKYKKQKKQKKEFSSREYGDIRAYYNSLPPGLAKKLRRGGRLPQGWKNKVNVGQHVPNDYLQYAKPVPKKLEAQLSAGPIGSKVLQIADRIIRVEAGTNMVLDAIKF